MTAQTMTVDEALLLADSIDQSINGRGLMTAAVVLAAEVRRLYAEIGRLMGEEGANAWPTIEAK